MTSMKHKSQNVVKSKSFPGFAVSINRFFYDHIKVLYNSRSHRSTTSRLLLITLDLLLFFRRDREPWMSTLSADLRYLAGRCTLMISKRYSGAEPCEDLKQIKESSINPAADRKANSEKRRRLGGGRVNGEKLNPAARARRPAYLTLAPAAQRQQAHDPPHRPLEPAGLHGGLGGNQLHKILRRTLHLYHPPCC